MMRGGLPAAAGGGVDDLVFSLSLSLSASLSLAFESDQQRNCNLSLALTDRIATKQAPKDSKRASNRSVDQSTKKTQLKKHSSKKKLTAVALNANRAVTGTLRGFDQFMNIVLDGAVDDRMKQDIGMVVSLRRVFFFFSFDLDLDLDKEPERKLTLFLPFFLLAFNTIKKQQVIRGNSIVTITALEPIPDT